MAFLVRFASFGTLGAVLLLPASAALAADPAATEIVTGLALLLVGVALGCALVLLALALPARRRLRLHQLAWASLPSPRQMVDRKGRVIDANPACLRLFGETAKPIPELLLALTGDEDARERITRLSANAANGTAGQAEVPICPRSAGPGARRPTAPDPGRSGRSGPGAEVEWLSVTVHPIRELPGTLFWQVDDITTRRQLEQVVHDEQASFVDLFDHAPIGFYSVDGQGRFLLANRTLAEWLGTAPDRILEQGLKLHDLVASPLPEGAPPYDPIGGETEGATGELLLRSADGGSFKALVSQDLMRDQSGRVVRTRSVVRHLSHEREMADALARSQRRFERFFADAPVGIALLDGAGRIVEYNRKMAAMAGHRESLPDGATLETLVADASAGAIQAGLARCHASDGAGGPEVPIEVRMRADAEVSCALFMTPIGGKLSGDGDIIVHFIDTTERKKLELQFVQSQKMQAVGQLAGGIAHDFNNLLTAMIGFSDLLLLRHQPGDQSFADIMQIKQNAIRAGNLVRQLLAFSRQQTLQPKVLNVTDILAELSHLLRRLIGENIELKMIHGRDLGSVKADQVQLEQVIINLAVNARDAMVGGGTLTIQTDNEVLAHEAKRHGEVVPPGHYTRIRVFDTGSGIDSSLLDRIFEPFFSTKEVGDGTGLALDGLWHRQAERRLRRRRQRRRRGQHLHHSAASPCRPGERRGRGRGGRGAAPGPDRDRHRAAGGGRGRGTHLQRARPARQGLQGDRGPLRRGRAGDPAGRERGRRPAGDRRGDAAARRAGAGARGAQRAPRPERDLHLGLHRGHLPAPARPGSRDPLPAQAVHPEAAGRQGEGGDVRRDGAGLTEGPG